MGSFLVPVLVVLWFQVVQKDGKREKKRSLRVLFPFSTCFQHMDFI